MDHKQEPRTGGDSRWRGSGLPQGRKVRGRKLAVWRMLQGRGGYVRYHAMQKPAKAGGRTGRVPDRPRRRVLQAINHKPPY